jgi:hypothetical protein
LIVEELNHDEQLFVECRRPSTFGAGWKRHNTVPYLTLVAARSEAEALATPNTETRVVRVTIHTEALGDL